MTKFDHRSQLPHLFREHDLSILPISRGAYEIGSVSKTFCEFEHDEVEMVTVEFPFLRKYRL